jgi:hypothetical protein
VSAIPQVRCRSALLLAALLSATLAAGCGDDTPETQAGAIDALVAVKSNESYVRPYETILDAGPNVTLTTADGTPVGDGDATAADALLVGQVVKVEGLYGSLVLFDEASGESSSERVAFNEGASSPVLGLRFQIDQILGANGEFGGAVGDEITIELGLPRYRDEPVDVDAANKEFTELGNLLVYLEIATGDAAPVYTILEGGGIFATIGADGALAFPVFPEAGEGLIPAGLTLDDVAAASAEPRQVVVSNTTG